MSFAATQDVRERIRDATDLVELVGSYVPLTRRGRTFIGLCPFHDDTRPSLNVDPQRQTYKCWACGSGGDVFAFVMQREGIDFRQALELLADRAGISLATSPERSARQDSRKQQLAVMAWAAAEYHQFLRTAPEAEGARSYLQQRGIEPSAVAEFRLGYAPDDWQWLRTRALKAGFGEALLESVGLTNRSAKSERSYDRFRQRVMFPIFDVQGRVIAFGGRVLPEHAPADAAKYINSPESALFKKHHHLYGLHLVRRLSGQVNEIIVVEGYTDAIVAHQAGIPNVVAVLGTALGARHLQLLKRYTERVILVLDGDLAGQRRANEVLGMFLAHPLDLRITTLPPDEDPCDFLLRHGADAFHELNRSAPDPLTYKLHAATSGIDLVGNPHAANKALEELLESIALITSGVAVSTASQRLRVKQGLGMVARTFQLSLEDIQTRLDELRGGQVQTSEPETVPPDRPILPTWDAEILALVLAHPSLAPRVAQELRGSDFGVPATREVFDLICRLTVDGQGPSLTELLTVSDELELKRVLVDLDEHAHQFRRTWVEPDLVLEELLHSFRWRTEEEILEAELARLPTAESNQEAQIEALTEIIERQRNRQGISKPTEG